MLRYLVHGWHEGSMPDTCEAHVSCMKRLSVRSIWGAFEVLCWFEFEVLTFESDVTPYRMKFERFYFAYHAMAFIFACRGRSKASTCKTSWSNVSKVSHELSLSCHPGIFSFHVMPCWYMCIKLFSPAAAWGSACARRGNDCLELKGLGHWGAYRLKYHKDIMNLLNSRIGAYLSGRASSSSADLQRGSSMRMATLVYAVGSRKLGDMWQLVHVTRLRFLRQRSSMDPSFQFSLLINELANALLDQDPKKACQQARHVATCVILFATPIHDWWCSCMFVVALHVSMMAWHVFMMAWHASVME